MAGPPLSQDARSFLVFMHTAYCKNRLSQLFDGGLTKDVLTLPNYATNGGNGRRTDGAARVSRRFDGKPGCKIGFFFGNDGVEETVRHR